MAYNKLSWLVLIVIISTITGCGSGSSGGGGGSSTPAEAGFASTFSGNIDPDGDGTAFIDYELSHTSQSAVNITIEFSSDGGTTFSVCTEDTSTKINGATNLTEGSTGLTAGPDGISHVFAWDTDSPNDLPAQNLNWLLVRISVENGESTTSDFLTLTNNGSDSEAPSMSSVVATAVQGSSNDTIIIHFDEPVVATEAENEALYSFEHPVGQSLTLPASIAFSYDAINMRTIIQLDESSCPNLQYGEDFVVTLSSFHDLAGNVVESGNGDEVSAAVIGDGATVPGDQPDLVLAYYIGSGNPSPGDILYLRFDEEMAIKAGSTFDNNDVDFYAGGDTIGTSSPILVSLYDAYTLQVTLGTSVSIEPTESRINFPTLNDAITDLAGNKPYMNGAASRSDYEEVIYYDSSSPIIDLLTLNEVPSILNGTGDAGGTLLVPRTGFDISMEYHDVGGAQVDTNEIEIFNSVDVTCNGSPVTAGTDLVPYLTLSSADDEGAVYTVPSTMTFTDGTNEVSARVKDTLGNASAMASFSFRVTAVTTGYRPFETTVNASQVWNLVFTRDLYTISASGTGSISVTATEEANGTADFDEDLILYGLACSSPVTVTGTAYNSNEYIKAQIIAAIKTELNTDIFPGVNITFTEVNQGALPAAQVAYNSFTHSQLAIGGDSDVGALGVAFVDRGNAHQDNDVLYRGSATYNPGLHLGIFTTRLYKFEVNGSSYGSFRQAFDTFIPGRGTPVGLGAGDQNILMDMAGTGPAVTGSSATRRDKIEVAITKLARFIAVVSSHEMGHSMGCSVNNAMPNGLYGGDATNFPGSDSNHINLSSFSALFSIPAVNIMIPATNFWLTNATGTRFNSLNLSYLKEKTYYNR